MRSLTSSIPTDIRIRSSVNPLASRTAEGMLACDIKHGMLIRDLTLPDNNKNNKHNQPLSMHKHTSKFRIAFSFNILHLIIELYEHKIELKGPFRELLNFIQTDFSLKNWYPEEPTIYSYVILVLLSENSFTKADGYAEVFGGFNNMP